MTTITCRCGSAALTFRSSRLAYHLLCACMDCRQAHEYAASQPGGPSARRPDGGAILQDLIYLENDVCDIKGAQSLKLQKLRADGRSTRLVCPSCHSILAVDHPGYAENIIMVPTATCVPCVPEPLPPQELIYTDDWKEDKDGPLPSFEAPTENPYRPRGFIKQLSDVEAATWVKLQTTKAWQDKEVEVLGLAAGVRLQDAKKS